MKVLLIKLVGVQIPEKFQIKQGIYHVQEAGKKKKKCEGKICAI